MLLRFIAENIFSFKEATEFNTFPSSKSKNHELHKVSIGHATALRMSAIYGANGAGKSNLISAMSLLREIVRYDLSSIVNPGELRFIFSNEFKNKSIELAVEFSINEKILYYYIEFNNERIISERLSQSLKTHDESIFERNTNINSEIDITFNQKYISEKITPEFKDAIIRILRPEQSLLRLLGKYYPSYSGAISTAYFWFDKCFIVVEPNSTSDNLPHLLHSNPDFLKMVNEKLPLLKTGVDNIVINVEELVSQEAQTLYKSEIEQAKKAPGVPIGTNKTAYDGIANIVYENDKLYIKHLSPQHRLADGHIESTPYAFESEGTRRLIELMPIFYLLRNPNKVFVIDEIECSIHPIMIKELMHAISDSSIIKGQLIFTTHESCLLDQRIFRPDEIWFAQKDTDQATQLYPLSDFNIHNTANIENGYLQGRYGGIPFLSNINDLNWE